jgi:hypothetical protein
VTRMYFVHVHISPLSEHSSTEESVISLWIHLTGCFGTEVEIHLADGVAMKSCFGHCGEAS